MEKEKKTGRVGVMDLVLLVICVLFLVGMLTVFRACAAHDDGSWMTCHWANMALDGMAVVLIVQSLLHLAVADPRRKQGIDFAMIPTALLAAILPGRLVGLCMMADMRCHRLMAPGAWVFALLIVAVAALDALIQVRRAKV